jgi:hypothetical protein
MNMRAESHPCASDRLFDFGEYLVRLQCPAANGELELAVEQILSTQQSNTFSIASASDSA